MNKMYERYRSGGAQSWPLTEEEAHIDETLRAIDFRQELLLKMRLGLFTGEEWREISRLDSMRFATNLDALHKLHARVESLYWTIHKRNVSEPSYDILTDTRQEKP